DEPTLYFTKLVYISIALVVWLEAFITFRFTYSHIKEDKLPLQKHEHFKSLWPRDETEENS
ncbi:MAG: hypothetical protein OD811_06060, partial [Alphaproteobacteria bacterium]